MSADSYSQQAAVSLRKDIALISTVVEAHLHAPVVNTRPIYRGESNAVFLMRTAAGQQVIARQHFDPTRRWFEKEVAVLQLLADRGLPVPAVLALEHTKVDDGIFSTALLTAVDGAPYDDTIGLSPRHHQVVIDQCWDFLDSIHSLGEDAVAGIAIASGDRLQWASRALAAMERLSSVSPAELRILARAAAELSSAPRAHREHRQLVHGDFHPKHVMLHRGVLTGVLDFEIAEMGDPAQDFAWWEFWRYEVHSQKERYPTLLHPGLLERYGADLAERIYVQGIATGLFSAEFYAERQEEDKMHRQLLMTAHALERGVSLAGERST